MSRSGHHIILRNASPSDTVLPELRMFSLVFLEGVRDRMFVWSISDGWVEGELGTVPVLAVVLSLSVVS